MNKLARQNQILRIVQRKPVHTQEELAVELRETGLDVTQVTLSRDIKELGLAKTAEGYRTVEPSGHRARDFAAVAAEFVTGVRAARNLLVVRTTGGGANAVAAALDREEWPEVVGTIAGDDTILIIAPDDETCAAVAERIRNFAG